MKYVPIGLGILIGMGIALIIGLCVVGIMFMVTQ
jgi:hypothetical protein